MAATFCSGNNSASTVTPSSRAITRPRAAWSPVRTPTSRPAALSHAITWSKPDRHCSAKTKSPRASLSHPTRDIDSPWSRACSSARSSTGPRCSPRSSMSRGLPSDIDVSGPSLSRMPTTPCPGTTRTRCALSGAEPRTDVCRCRSQIACEKTCDEHPASAAARARALSRSSGCSNWQAPTTAAPVVSVPVLSNRTAPMSASRSSASPLRKRTW